jgi:CheY-like chemotaxis protein
VIRKRILLANDPELLRALENSFFGRSGFVLMVAGSEQQAFDLIEEQDPALAIFNLDLPGLRGDVCCRRVKSDPILRSMPVILVIRPGTDQELMRCGEARCDGILHKPIDNQQLMETACKLLNIAKRGGPRIDVRLSLRCGSDPKKLRPGQILNLNVSGAFIATEKLFPVDTRLTVEFFLPARKFPIRCKARVAWVNHPEWVKTSHLPTGMGVEFLDLIPEDLAGLKNHLQAAIPGADRQED